MYNYDYNKIFNLKGSSYKKVMLHIASQHYPCTNETHFLEHLQNLCLILTTHTSQNRD